MRLTVDTNVIFAALYNQKGASAFIFDLFASRKVTFSLSVPTFLEYQDVLQREQLRERIGLDADEMKAILRFIAYQAEQFDINFLWRPNLRDEADNMFVELAIQSQSQFLITSNLRDFTRDHNLQFDDLNIVTPKQFVQYWRTYHE